MTQDVEEMSIDKNGDGYEKVKRAHIPSKDLDKLLLLADEIGNFALRISSIVMKTKYNTTDAHGLADQAVSEIELTAMQLRKASDSL